MKDDYLGLVDDEPIAPKLEVRSARDIFGGYNPGEFEQEAPREEPWVNPDPKQPQVSPGRESVPFVENVAQVWYFGEALDIEAARQEIRRKSAWGRGDFDVEGYTPTPDEILKWADEFGLPDSTFEKLAEAKSPDDLEAIANAWATRMYRDRRLAETETGVTGFVKQTAIAMLDPTAMALFGGVDKLAAPIRVGTRFGQGLKSAAIGGVAMAPLEAAKVLNDPFYDAEDAAFTVVGSMLLSGAFGALVGPGVSREDVSRLDDALANELQLRAARKDGSTVGATQASPIVREQPAITNDTAPEKAGFGSFGTPVNFLARSDNPDVRELSETLTWNPGGQRAQDVTAFEAARRVYEAGTVYARQARIAATEWARANGRAARSPWSPMGTPNDTVIGQFMEIVAQVHAGVRESADPHVLKAVKAYQDGYEDALNYLRNSSYNGPGSESLGGLSLDEFASIEHDPQYVMRRFSAPGWRRVSQTLGPEKAANRLAEVVWRSNRDRLLEQAQRLAANGVSPSNGGKFTFGGKKALTLDGTALRTAEEMEAAGKQPREIWKATGLYRAKDKKWRFEINDEAARWMSNPLRLKRGTLDNRNAVRLGDVLDHKELFAAYPDLRQTTVVVTSRILDKDAAGVYDDAADEVLLRPTDRDSMLRVLLHELQHAIQKRERFADGTGSTEILNPEWRTFSRLSETEAGDAVLWLHADYADEIAEAESRRASMLAEGADEATIAKALGAQFPSWAEYTGHMRALEAKGYKPEWLDSPPEQFVESHDKYLRLHGEAEARNVETRQGFSTEQRQGSFPEDTLDVPVGELIVRPSDPRKGMSYSKTSGMTREGLLKLARDEFGEGADALFDSLALSIVDEAPAHWPEGAIAEAVGDRVTMVASRVTPETFRGFVLHEVGIHTDLERVFGIEGRKALLGNMERLVQQAEKARASGAPTAEQSRILAARERAIRNSTSPSHIAEETLAYLVQEAPELAPIKQFIADVRAWLYREFPAIRGALKLTESDLQAVALGVVNRRIRDARREGPAYVGDNSRPAGEPSYTTADAPPRATPEVDIEAAGYRIARQIASKYIDTVSRLMNPATKRASLHTPVTPEFRKAAKEVVRDLFNEGADFADNVEDAMEMVLDLVAPVRRSSVASDRAKPRLKLDLKAGLDDDILPMWDWNAEALYQSYRRQAAGHAGFLKAGFTRIQDFDARVQRIRESASLLPHSDQLRTAKAADMLDLLKGMVLGNPPEWLKQGGEDWAWAVSQVRKYNFTNLMNNVGFLSFSEVMGAVTKMGPFRLLASIPSYRKYIKQVRAGDPKALESIYYTADALMGHGSAQVRSRMTGFADRMEDNFSAILDSETSGFKGLTERVTRKSSNATARLSGMAPLGEWLRSAIAGADAQDWVRAARKGGAPYGERRMMALGIDKDMWTRISAQLNKMTDMKSPDTGQLRPFIDFSAWDDGEAANAFMNAIDRNSRRLVMEGDAGHTAFWLDRPSPSLLFQFLKFPLNAWSKHLTFSANVHDPRALYEAGMMALGGGLGHVARVAAIAYATKTAGEERDKYLEENLNDNEVAKSILYYSAHGSILPNAWDAGGYLAGLAGVEVPPEVRFSRTRASTLPGDPLSGNATITHMYRMLRSAGDAVEGPFTGQDLESLWKAWAPLGNHVAMLAAINQIADLLPQETDE